MPLYMPRRRVAVFGLGYRVWLERSREKVFNRAAKVEDIVIQLFTHRDT